MFDFKILAKSFQAAVRLPQSENPVAKLINIATATHKNSMNYVNI